MYLLPPQFGHRFSRVICLHAVQQYRFFRFARYNIKQPATTAFAGCHRAFINTSRRGIPLIKTKQQS